MADPVSWLLIEPGWRVEDSTGEEVGRVLEVGGDSNADIFDGLAIAFSALGAQHYVPSEQVGTITEGTVPLGQHLLWHGPNADLLQEEPAIPLLGADRRAPSRRNRAYGVDHDKRTIPAR